MLQKKPLQNQHSQIDSKEDDFNSVLKKTNSFLLSQEKKLPKIIPMKWYKIEERYPPDSQEQILIQNRDFGSYEVSFASTARHHSLMEKSFWKKKETSIKKWMLIE